VGTSAATKVGVVAGPDACRQAAHGVSSDRIQVATPARGVHPRGEIDDPEASDMMGHTPTLPVRVYEAGEKIMIAAPMAGLAPEDIAVTVDDERVRIRGAERGPRQHGLDLAVAEWTVGPYDREVRLPSPVDGRLTNVTYGNGVLVVAMPKIKPGERRVTAEIELTAIEATRGEHVGHVGRVPRPTTTTEHVCAKHAG
jgi:HSP20 family protein